MAERAVCEVPFCRNSSAKWAGHRYICGPHFRVAGSLAKAEHRRVERIVKRRGGWDACGDQWRRNSHFAFTQLVESATEAAAGIG